MKSFKLRSCVWEITLACCFNCKYCGSSGGKKRENELSLEECLDVCEQLANLGCKRVSMIGGEVFIRSDWHIIVKKLTDLGIRTNLITNGYMFTPGIIELLKSVNVESVSVSLDGPKEVHDKYRQEGSYDRAIKAIETLTENGIPTSVISTLNAENSKCLEEFYETLKQYDIFAWQLQSCSPMGNAANSGIDYMFDSTKVIDFVEKYYDVAPFMLGIADNIGYYTEGEGHLRGNKSGLAKFRGCSAGLNAIGIDSIGNVRGCESMYDECFNEGNLREKTLREIWENPDGFAYNRQFKLEMLTGACAKCEFGKYCAGGCRSYNHFVHNKLYEAPNCAKNY